MIPLTSAGDEKFVMVERRLIPQDQGQWFRDFEKFEVERMVPAFMNACPRRWLSSWRNNPRNRLPTGAQG